MEKLPDHGTFFKSPLNTNDRKEFIKAFIEYRKNFPIESTRDLTLGEHLPAHKFHINCISTWFRLANDREEDLVARGNNRIIDYKCFIPKYAKSLELILETFKDRKMI